MLKPFYKYFKLHPTTFMACINGTWRSSIYELRLHPTPGKTKRGGINVPVMFIHISTEISCPRSAETNPPTCRLAVLAKTFEGLPCTIVMSVSSQLKIRCGGNLYYPSLLQTGQKIY